jgi:hypothetical protein
MSVQDLDPIEVERFQDLLIRLAKEELGVEHPAELRMLLNAYIVGQMVRIGDEEEALACVQAIHEFTTWAVKREYKRMLVN